MATTRPDAVICDIDGTLALHTDRSPFDWHRVLEDRPNTPVIELVQLLAAAGITILYTSGRDEMCRDDTAEWLSIHVGVDGPLLMRARNDNRKDRIVKYELFQKHITGKYNIKFVLDDRDQVVDLWRTELHLPCFQVAPGDF